MNQQEIVTIADAPIVTLNDGEPAGEDLLKFYRALGWNGQDIFDPCKVQTTEAVYQRLYNVIFERCPDGLTVGAFMVNKAPSVDATVPQNKVYLMVGWVSPAKEQGGV